MNDLFQKANSHFNQKLPFVIYSKPNSNKIVGVFQNNEELHELKDFTENGFAFVSFDGKKKYYLPFAESAVYVDTITTDDFYLSNEIVNNVDENIKITFENLVKSGVEAIKNNQFKKVVLSRKEAVSIANFDIETIFNKLIYNYKNAFKYCFHHPEIGLWIGATPEQFIKIDGNKLKTVALAGTQLLSESIVWEEKEVEEQQFVTEFILDGLKPFSTTIHQSEVKNIVSGNLVHLITEIETEINEKEVAKIIEALHPTPAVCGLPKNVTKDFILENEKYNREFYTGFIGELNCDFTNLSKKSDLFVNLRCMKIENNVANVFVGCGITKDSSAKKEFIESVNKSMTMKKVL